MAASPPPPSDDSDFDLSLSADGVGDVDGPEAASPPMVVGGKVINGEAAALPVEEGQPPSFVFLQRLKKKGKAAMPEGGAPGVLAGGKAEGKPLGLGGEAVRRGPLRKRS